MAQRQQLVFTFVASYMWYNSCFIIHGLILIGSYLQACLVGDLFTFVDSQWRSPSHVCFSSTVEVRWTYFHAYNTTKVSIVKPRKWRKWLFHLNYCDVCGTYRQYHTTFVTQVLLYFRAPLNLNLDLNLTYTWSKFGEENNDGYFQQSNYVPSLGLKPLLNPRTINQARSWVNKDRE